MNLRLRSVVPSMLLALGGSYVVYFGLQLYMGPGDGIGFLPEIILAIHLLLGGGMFVVSGYAVVYDRPRLSLTVLAGFVTLVLTFVLGVYKISRNTQLDTWLGLALIAAASAATWILSEWIFESEKRPN